MLNELFSIGIDLMTISMVLLLCVLLLLPCFFILSAMIWLITLLIHAMLSLLNRLAMQYTERHIDEITKVTLYPWRQVYTRLDIPQGYSDDGWHCRCYYRYKYIPLKKKRKAKIYFKNKRHIMVSFPEDSATLEKIMMRAKS